MKSLIAALLLCAAVVYGQGTTALVNGTVTDPTGAAVPAAQVTLTNVDTDHIVKTVTNEKGTFAFPSMPAGNYKASVTKEGFKAALKTGIEINSGVDVTVNFKLELGQATETVMVQGGAELVQTTSAELSSTITGRQINELPTATRNGMESFLQLPGTQTLTGYRDSYINGLPRESLNVTIDGVPTNDQWLKSSDGFFSYIMPSVDSLEEVTLSTSASGVDSTAQGGAQLKFTTKSGTNQYHGGVVWAHRNTFLNANYYFNNQTGAPRDIMKFNQGNVHVGGPIKKDKLLFFVNYEIYKLPQSATFTRTILPQGGGWNGIFSYCPTTSTLAACQGNSSLLKTVNVYNLAAAANANLPAGVVPYKTAADPTSAQTLSQIWNLVQGGNLRPNSSTGTDFMRDTLTYAAAGTQDRYFLTDRLDYNLTVKHHISLVTNYDWYNASPDVLNGVVPVYPGTGTVLGSNIIAGQRSRRFAGSVSLRSSLSATLTNEARFGLAGGSVLFYDLVGSDALYSEWKGFNPGFGYWSGVTTNAGPSRRNAPTKDFADTVSWVKGPHQFSFGGTFTSIATWQSSIGSETIPGISFGTATGDPATTGSTAWLTTANVPGISTSDLGSLESMYAALTGRVSSISQQVVQSETSHQYGHNPAIDRNHQREFGLFAQDTWRLAPNLTATIGLRMEYQFPFVNVNGTYSQVGLAGIWGISGIGNMFKPGVLTGVQPTFTSLNGRTAYNPSPLALPSLGIAYQLQPKEGALALLTGHHTGAAVLRAGFSISSTRPGGYNFQSIWGSNKGLY
ncbi:MAG TPA: carboxypeptidase regulatory-like domain-containing protein, partial [Verrucomicrobiae bacterium]|nr:carboxypeptidase regulatory-like domain-containing protein [Verrucomicrobiae bacterium]